MLDAEKLYTVYVFFCSLKLFSKKKFNLQLHIAETFYTWCTVENVFSTSTVVKREINCFG